MTRQKERIKTETSRHCLRFLMRQKNRQKSPCRPMCGNTDSRIWEGLAWRILNKEILACGIRNPGLWNTEYSSRNPQSHLRLESEIQDPLTINSYPVPRTRNPRRGTVMDFLASRSKSYQCELILGTSKLAPRVDICQIHEILSGKECSLYRQLKTVTRITFLKKLTIDHLTLDSREKKFHYPRVCEIIVS